jgi:hypothetical protein
MPYEAEARRTSSIVNSQTHYTRGFEEKVRVDTHDVKRVQTPGSQELAPSLRSEDDRNAA